MPESPRHWEISQDEGSIAKSAARRCLTRGPRLVAAAHRRNDMTKSTVNRPDIYLCGPMTDVKGHNLTAFARAEEHLAELGFSVFNPGTIQDETMSFEDYMKPELKILLGTKKALVALPGWEAGVGSRLEVMVALSVGLPVHSYSDSQGLGAPLFSSIPDARQAVKDLMNAGVPRQETLTDVEEIAPHLEAAELVLGPRGAYYDHPYDNFQRTAHMWTGILYSKLRAGETIDPDEVSLCLVALKLAREAFRHKRDNVVDGHGYLLTHMMVLERMQELNENASGDDSTG